MDKESKKLFGNKIAIGNMILKKLNKNDIIYNLVLDDDEKNKLLFSIYTYIPDFFKELWKSPKSVATILLNTDNDNIKNNIASFVVNKLYYNIFSVNHKDDQLLYIIALLLKNEINSLNDINKVFLNNTKCGIILQELNKKKEVKIFFKKVILDSFKELDIIKSTLNICFDIKEIIKKYEKNISLTKDENYYKTYEKIIKKKSELFNKSNNIKKFESINEKYINLLFNKEELNKKINEYGNNKNMKDFIEKIIKNWTLSPNKYININIFDNISNNKEKIINYYINSFIEVIEIIDKIFDKLLNYSECLPYSIKCICRIISILINKKFPNDIKVEQNKFLVNFFFYILFFPALINPALNIYINEIMISNRMINKLEYIKELLINITSGKLFEKNFLTPFNWFIIEKMPKLLEFFDNICQVELPPFIEKLINDELPENYEYDYFKENPEEDNIYRIICYNIEELYTLVTVAEKCKNDISINDKILSKFKKNNKKLIEMKDSMKYKEIGNKILFYNLQKEINCFLQMDLINKDKKLDNLLSLKEHKNYFSLKELKVIETEEEKIQNNIIKIKNCFYALLYNLEMISKNNLKKENLGDVINILKELNKQTKMNSSDINNNIYIPSNWYTNSLIQNLPKLPKKLIENDFRILFEELENEITNSIKNINFEKLNKIFKYAKELEKENLYYETIKNTILDIDLNQIADNFIKKNRIIIDLKSEDKYSLFFKNVINEKKTNFSTMFLIDNKKNLLFSSINYFLYNFPDIAKFQLSYDIDYFEFIKKKNIPQIINNYLALIRNNLTKEKKINNEQFDLVYNKIYDYIMENLYEKLFPKEPIINDMEIFQNCYKHIWVELSHLLEKNKNYIFDNFLPDSINYFKQFEKEKSPRKKLINLKNLFNCIYNLGKFNGYEIDTDEEYSLLLYSFIKSKVERIYSNYYYVDLFLENKEGLEANQLTKIKAVCEHVKKMSFEKLYNINETEYTNNCSLVSKGIFF